MTKRAGVAVSVGYPVGSLCRESPCTNLWPNRSVVASADYTQAIGVYESGEQCDRKRGIGDVLPRCSTTYPSTELQWGV
jgi:hypothetical protein